ncbi:MAG TPA: class I SAM-dependent methyltransferase [Phycisphaerae bacterium]|nr:class I SAM-dependent methyltransferase [Phycisphaerae bacterium]HRR85132.1 class I SAM-dependent methyltransferase [Phycisphaerae bacterium]
MPEVQTPIRQPGSFRDPSGFVFEFNGRILRAVDEDCLRTVRELLDGGLLGRLIDEGLIVPTSLVESPDLLRRLKAVYPGQAGFLEHERIHPVSYPYEWSPSMLADAGVCTIDLQIRLLEHGFSLKDATAYNIQFRHGRPVFIDVPSIERPPRLDVWIALGQFGRMFTNPLLLNRYKGQSLRSCFLADLDGSDVSRVQRAFGRLERLSPRLLLDVTLPYWLGRRASRLGDAGPRRLTCRQTTPAAQIINLRRLRSKLRNLAARNGSAGHWATYSETCSYTDRAEESKVREVRRFLTEHRPASVLDVGSNTGRYSMLALEAGAKVVSIDSDQDCIDLLYRRIRHCGHPILPLCVDIANPSPAIGFRNRERASFLERVRADCVLALALIHHLHVSANLPVAGIRDMLADLCDRHLVLEFVPTDDVMFRKLMQFRVDVYQDFTLDACIRAFEERFDVLRQVPVVDSRRTLLFMRKKDA